MQAPRRSALSSVVTILVIGLMLVLGSALVSRSADEDKGILANLLSRVLSTPTTRVSIGSVEGALSSDATIHDITIADRDGVWLQLDQVRLVWRRTALLLRRLEVDRLEVGTLRILRKPLPALETVPTPDTPILPELPVKVEIKNFSLRELVLGAPVVGVAARVAATGAATLGNPSEGLNLRFDARRLDAPGTLTARLGLVPQTERLDLTLAVQEPSSGILVHALNVPGLPPVTLDLNGSGTLDAFTARLAFDAGDSIGATGSAQLRREAAARRLNLDLAARIEGLLPALAAPVFAGTTQLNGSIVFSDSGAITIAPLSVASQTARLDIQGGLSVDRIANLKISARTVPNAGNTTSAEGAEIGKLVFDATVSGPWMGPRIDATLDAQDIASPQGRVEKLAARFNASPRGTLLDESTSIPFTADAQVSGLAPSDPALARALGGSMSLALAGGVRNGIANLQTARLQTPTSDIRFTGQVGRSVLQGRLMVGAPDLARFGDLASLKLHGVLGVTAELSGAPKDGRIEAKIDGRATRFATGIAAVDGLAGGRLDLNGTIRKLPRGGYGFGDLRLAGAHVSARVDGEATVAQANIDARLTIPDLKRADERLSGRAEVTAKLSGTVEHPDATATIAVTDARARGRPIPRLTLETVASDVTGMLDARATLSGTVDGKPVQGALHIAKQSAGGWRLDGLDLRIGSVTAQGGVTLDAGNLADGRMAIDARDLDDLSPFVLTKLSGQLRADATLTVADGGQNGALSAQARSVKVGEAALDRLTAQAQVTDAYRRPVLDADVAIDRAHIGGDAISQIRLVAKGAPDASAITLTARARGFAIDARGRLVPADQIRFELSTLTARRGQHRLVLQQPASLTLRDQGVGIRALTLALDRGRLSVNGRVGATLDLTVMAQSVPLSISEVVVPNLGLSGTLNAEAKITGPAAAPTGTWRLRIEKLAAPQMRDAGVPPLDVTASGRLADRRSTIEAAIRAAGAGTLSMTGTVPLQGQGLDLRVNGQFDIGVANQLLSAAGRRMTGKADIDLRIAGTWTAPSVNGHASIAGGSYADAALGIRYTGIAGRLTARGTEMTIERLTAQTPNGGTITAQGSVRVDPGAGFPGTIRISAQRAQLIANDIVSAVASLSLSLSGPLARSPQISGRVDVVSLDVTIPERLPMTLRPVEGARHVAPPPTAAARLAAEARARARAGRAPAFDVALDLVVSAPNRVFVRGRGIDAELGGDVRLRGRLSDPVTIGAFDLRRGRMTVAGTRLDFTRGRIAFTGNLTPDLDFVAQTRAGDITAIISITGQATQPSFMFSSEPDLPQDEILSRILFSRASGGLSPIQALQLAQVAAQFSGDGGTDVFERLRRSLGVDSLDISTSAKGNPTVGISRAINRRISIGVKAGAEAKDSAVSVDVDVTRNLRLQGEVNHNGGTAVGIGMEWEY
ncbi:MAG: hypothetical protein GEU91_00355 [Rhizobiales bacterium]|nr:hypothetical protein [Hyphomicrobiales bacterium]